MDLSPEQKTQIRDLLEQEYEKSRELLIKIMDLQFELRQLRWQDANPAAVEAKKEELKNLRSQLQQIRQEYRQKMEYLLTPKQKAKLQNRQGCKRDPNIIKEKRFQKKEHIKERSKLREGNGQSFQRGI